MPRVKRKHMKIPEDFELLEDTLDAIEQKMREAENEDQEGKRKQESIWPIFRIHHQRSRYVYEMFYKKKKISRECYEFCLREGYADAALIAKWKKKGYERLCCLRCIQPKDTNFGTTCICRVPTKNLDSNVGLCECSHCGCRGCASGN
mmetsp:Transcript_39229/g.77126  ORF Transcript_39229/g.77126 Transcript_39229/m.77126 type:complete len:148 (+) Transcript_39229:32-475(+)